MRLLFSKEGVAVWSSHLDLMRALQRSFRRAGLELKHSQGYSPHPILSILMPLSVGVSSVCEIAEFELAEGCQVPAEEIASRLAPALPEGIRAIKTYEGGMKPGKLAWLRAELKLSYDRGLPEGAAQAVADLLSRPSLVVEKHSKKGPVEVDVAPMLKEVQVEAPAHAEAVMAPPDQAPAILGITALCAAQNPTLNPLLLVTAIETQLPELKPDFVACRRLEIYDGDGRVFR